MRPLIALALLLPAIAGAVDNKLTCETDLPVKSARTRWSIVVRNLDAVHDRTFEEVLSLGKHSNATCHTLGRELLHQLADADRELSSAKVLDRRDADAALRICAQYLRVGNRTRTTSCS